MNSHNTLAAALSFSAVIGAAVTFSPVNAHKGATGVVKERMMAMKSMGRQMKELGAMVTGKTTYDADRAREIAAALTEHMKEIPDQFPKDSLDPPTEALPGIWQNWEDFRTKATESLRAAEKLAAAAGDGRQSALAATGALGKSCKSCHSDYREK